MRFAGSVVSGLALLTGFAAAHPGHDLTQEIKERREFLNSVKRTNLDHCAGQLKARGVQKRNIERRAALLEKARAKRASETLRTSYCSSILNYLIGGLTKKRDLNSVLATDHNATDLGYTTNTDAATLFAGYNSCLLTPEVTQGPYCRQPDYNTTTQLLTLRLRRRGRVCP